MIGRFVILFGLLVGSSAWGESFEVTMPTPIGVQEAVVPGVAYTSRVLWRWVKTRYDLWASLIMELP